MSYVVDIFGLGVSIDVFDNIWSPGQIQELQYFPSDCHRISCQILKSDYSEDATVIDMKMSLMRSLPEFVGMLIPDLHSAIKVVFKIAT